MTAPFQATSTINKIKRNSVFESLNSLPSREGTVQINFISFTVAVFSMFIPTASDSIEWN